jgi:hypothetical protein
MASKSVFFPKYYEISPEMIRKRLFMGGILGEADSQIQCISA